MGILIEHHPVKTIIAVLTSEPSLLPNVYQHLTDELGEIDYTSELIPFNSTTYYEAEMGRELQRQFISFEHLMDAGALADRKLFTNNIEQLFVHENTQHRRVNLDIGYVCMAKLILASTKDHAHRIYLRDGIFAEMTLRYYQKTFQAWEWTYPDYRSQTYIAIFNHIRKIYRKQLDIQT